jgi:hypothetical protein
MDLVFLLQPILESCQREIYFSLAANKNVLNLHVNVCLQQCVSNVLQHIKMQYSVAPIRQFSVQAELT